MKNYKIAVIPGDGIGPEVIREGLKILDVVSKKYHFTVDLKEFPYWGQHYMDTGEVLPESAMEELKTFDTIYLGAVGHPEVKPGILERGILLKLRFDFEQYINLRPVKLYENVETPLKNKKPEDIDYTVVRENTGGLYIGEGEFIKKDTSEEVAIQKMVYSRRQVERCIRYAFELIKEKHTENPWKGLTQEEKEKGFIGKLTLCGKTNVLTYAFDLWERAFNDIAKEYPMVITDYVHVDAACIYMIESPQRFNVIVTSNMFGDIITDLAAVTQGGMGVAPSGNINPKGTSMFEPVHGSAPQFTNKGVINPIATIATLQLMLNHLGEAEAAMNVELAMREVIKKMKSMLVGEMGYTTSEIGDMVVEAL